MMLAIESSDRPPIVTYEYRKPLSSRVETPPPKSYPDPNHERELIQGNKTFGRRTARTMIVSSPIPLRFLPALLLSVLLTWTTTTTWALKFDLTAHPAGQHKKSERCIRNFVAKDTLVVVTARIDGSKGDGQIVNMHVGLQKKKILRSSPTSMIYMKSNPFSELLSLALLRFRDPLDLWSLTVYWCGWISTFRSKMR